MSWSCNIDAPTKMRAAELVDEANIPEKVRAYIKDAIAAYPNEDTSLKIVAFGHECAHSTDRTQCNVTVHPA